MSTVKLLQKRLQINVSPALYSVYVSQYYYLYPGEKGGQSLPLTLSK